ncbi:MAG: cytochrome P450 [Chloroflexota bacterium]
MTQNRYDLFSANFKANPFPTYEAMRQADPIYAHHPPNGQTMWYITRYEDVLSVLKDTERFVKDQRSIDPEEGALGVIQPVNGSINENMLFADPPEHTRLRALVNLAFTPQRVRQMTPQIERVAEQLLDTVLPQGEMDLITDYALPLPIMIICDMLGVPEKDQTELCDLSQAIISPGRLKLSFSRRKRKLKRFVALIRQVIDTRKKQPQDDLITALVQAEIEGDKLSADALSSMVALLLVTGHETTVNLIGNGALALLQHPEQLEILKSDPTQMAAAIEEILRFDGPVETSTTRWAKTDVDFRGHRIRRGDVVRVVLASANRDPAFCPHADTFDISRQEGRHLAFGHGIHYCLGAPLARLEGQIAFEALFRKMPTLRLNVSVEKLVWRSGVLFRGLEQLPVCWG